MFNKNVLFGIVLFFIARFANAQQVWDWNKCLAYAEENNLQLKINVINQDLAALEVRKNKFNYTPNINASSNYSLRIGNNYNYFSNQYETQVVHYNDYGLNVNQPVFDGFATKHQIEKATIDLEALKLDNEVLKNNIQLQILTAYLNILSSKEQAAQLAEQHKNTLEQRNQTQEMVNAGALPEGNLYDIDAQIATEDANITLANSQINLAYLNLKTVLQMNLDSTIEVKTPNFDHIDELGLLPKAAAVYASALDNRPELKSLALKTESARKNIDIAKANYYPTLNFIGNIGTFFSSQNTTTSQTTTGNFIPIGFVDGTLQQVLIPETQTSQSRIPYFKQLNNTLSYTLGLSLNIPIYNKNAVKFAVNQAKLNVELTELQTQQAQQDLQQNIQQAYINALNAQENYKAAKKTYDITNASYDIAAERVKAGLASQLEVNLAKNNVNNALSRLIQSKYEYIFNAKVLDYYQNKPIQF
ncbi:MAG: TolC family protein [Chitinophagales bacterium]|nr:TolC family protein [Chitinophagales bacterium]